MNFKIPHKQLLKALQKVQSIIERREIKPILSNILIKTGKNNIEIYATNLEVSIKEVLAAEVLEKGGIVLDAKKIYEIIREMPEKEISFKKKENDWVEISTGDILFTVVGLDHKEFPETSFFEDETPQEINKKKIKEMIEKTIYAASNDETRTNLSGVFFEKTKQKGKEIFRLVATDGHRLAMIEREASEVGGSGGIEANQLEKGVLFPKKGLLELKKMTEEDPDKTQTIYFLLKKNIGIFKKENTLLAIRVIDEEFPNYKQAIPEDTKSKATTNRANLLSSLKRISTIAEERSKAVSLRFSKKNIEIFSLNPVYGEGKETIPANHDGEEIKLGFNAGYLIESLAAINGEEVVIKIKDKDSPVIIMGPAEDNTYICVIMPMEIKE